MMTTVALVVTVLTISIMPGATPPALVLPVALHAMAAASASPGAPDSPAAPTSSDAPLASSPQTPRAGFAIEEATIAQVHQALRDRRLTCRALVQHYLDRIDRLDKRGPAINAIILTHPGALARADALDAQAARGGAFAPLHCVPVIVKDNYDTFDLPTSAGSLSLKDFTPAADAFMVARLRDAGAVILAKSNMAEFAFSPYETVGSRLPGYSRNPYALARVTAGSSGGTAAAVAANFGLVGIGTDTGNSIRGPSSHQSLVGIRPTMGLTSRAGIVPLSLAADMGGPMTRTVEDAARLLQVLEGVDPDDPATAASQGRTHPPYVDALVKTGLKGARLGVLRLITRSETADPAVIALFEAALRDLAAQGATIVDPLELPGFDELRKTLTPGCDQFKFDLNQYLARAGDRAPVKSLEEIIKSRQFHPSIERRLEMNQKAEIPPEQNPACRARDAFREQLRTMVVRAMDEQRLDALLYPTWNNRPRLIGDLNTPHGDNNQVFSPSTGFPAITVPMGYVEDALPAGLQFFGRAWSESTLFRLAFAYEQATHHRRVPPIQ